MQIMLCTYSSCDRLPCCEQGKCLVLGEQQREGMLSSKLLEASGAVTCINMYLCPHTTIRVCTCKNVCMNRHTDTDPHKMGPIPEHLAAIKWLPDITEMTVCCRAQFTPIHSSIFYAPSQAESQQHVGFQSLTGTSHSFCTGAIRLHTSGFQIHTSHPCIVSMHCLHRPSKHCWDLRVR